MFELRVRTSRAAEARDITNDVAGFVKDKEGKLVHIYTPHTTCGIMINENADPDVARDIIEGFDRIVPEDYPYRHQEGNSHAHIKAVMVGCSVFVPISEGRMLLGTWQGIFLMEFDGPRERKIIITVV